MGDPRVYQLTIHHVWWPHSDYTTPLEACFRDLSICKVSVCAYTHQYIHRYQSPPRKPSKAVMYEFVLQEKGYEFARQFQKELTDASP